MRRTFVLRLRDWSMPDNSYLKWMDKEGRLHVEEENGRHPWEVFEAMRRNGLTATPQQEGNMMRQCHRRLKWSMLHQCRGDHTAEIVNSRKLFDKILGQRAAGSPTGHPPMVGLRSLFRLLCKAKLPGAALDLRRRHEGYLTLDLSCYTFLLSSLVVTQSPEACPKQVYSELRALWAGTGDHFFAVQTGVSRPLQNAANITLLMLQYAAVQKAGAAAGFRFFRAYRTARNLQDEMMRSPRPVKEEDLVGRLEFPAWPEEGGPQHLSLSYGPSTPAVDPLPFQYLAAACTDLSEAAGVLREAAAQGSADATLLQQLLKRCAAVPDPETSFSLLSVAAPTASGPLPPVFALHLATLGAAGESSPVPYLQTLRLMSSCGTPRMTRNEALAIAKLLSKHCANVGCGEMTEWMETHLGFAGPDAVVYLDRVKGTSHNLRGRDLTEDGMHAGQPARQLAWERTASVARAADSTHHCGRPPWKKCLEAVAADFKSSQPVFSYRYAGSASEFRASVVGDHPFVALTTLIQELGGSLPLEKALWTAAGDGGVSTLIQVSRVRLVYSMSVTVLGGFTTVLQAEVANTQALFQQAGGHGVAGRWVWQALRIYEDEVDDILEERGVAGRDVPLYRRITAANTRAAPPRHSAPSPAGGLSKHR